MPKTDLREVVGTITLCRDTDTTLSAGARHALLVLASYYPNIFPPQKRLAENMGASRSSVNRWLAELERAGLITRRRGGQHYATHYLLHPSLIRKRERKAPRVYDDSVDF